MKKNLLLVIVASLMSVGVYAQGAYVGVKIGMSQTEWYGNDVTTLGDADERTLMMGKGQTDMVKGESEYDLISVNDPNGSIGKRWGFHGGIQINSTISDYFWLKHEFVFATKGFDYNGTLETYEEDTVTMVPVLTDSSAVNMRFRTYNVDIMPVSLAGHYEGIQLFVGPYVSIALGGSWVDKTNSKVLAPGVNDFVYVEKNDDFNDADFNPTKASRELSIVDFGLVAGFEYELPFGLNAGIRYMRGFGSALETTQGESRTDAFNKELRFSLGYTFGKE